MYHRDEFLAPRPLFSHCSFSVGSIIFASPRNPHPLKQKTLKNFYIFSVVYKWTQSLIVFFAIWTSMKQCAFKRLDIPFQMYKFIRRFVTNARFVEMKKSLLFPLPKFYFSLGSMRDLLKSEHKENKNIDKKCLLLCRYIASAWIKN